MSTSTEPITWYDAHAGEVALNYEAIDPARLHGWFEDLLPPAPALVLDVGAGTGRDAAWLAVKGYGVVAAEPSAAMRAEAGPRHAGAGIAWVEIGFRRCRRFIGRGSPSS